MSSWLISCNPKVYNHAASFRRNGYIDWITVNNFEEGDIVYIYEVIPPRGRGAIVYKAEVVKAVMAFNEKTDDREFWKDGVYPKDYTGDKFSRLKLVAERDDNALSLASLSHYDFTPPQGVGHLLDKKPGLLSYIQSHFGNQ